jgi:acetaldehyde dehydrogenase/alcohol dehydrogenase
MWLLYEHPDVDFMDLSMRFMDIRKRVYMFPKMGQKAKFIAVATSAGTGSEVTPFAVITDDESGVKYPIADYELLPTMAIVDVNFMMDMPKGLTAASGLDALSHALESYASMFATDFTKGLSLQATKQIFDFLPTAFNDGHNVEAREKMAYASTIAGMAFSNGLLGICHSMAHKVGMHFKVPHGIANAILIKQTIRFNATENPKKMGAFSQYPYPVAVQRYAEVARHCGLEGKDEELSEKLIAKIDDLRNAVGVKATLKDYIPDEKEFLAKVDLMSEQAFDDQCTGANPRYPLVEELKELYLNAFYGR